MKKLIPTFLMFLSLAVTVKAILPAGNKPSELKVMTWNIWGKMNLDQRYTINGKTGRDRVIEIIRNSGADIVTMTETYGSAKDIAHALGFYYYTPSKDANLTIFSRYPIEDYGKVKRLPPFSFIVATVKLPGGGKVRVYNIWLTSGGRHIAEIKNKELSDEEFVEGDNNRYENIMQLLEHPSFRKDLDNSEQVPVIVAGDFNCVSHLDYTPETKARGLNFSRILPEKTSMAMLDAGFTDSYRAVHPEVTKKTLGYTWNTVGMGFTYENGKGFVPVDKDKNPQPGHRGLFARIDFIYYAGSKIEPAASETISHYPGVTGRCFPEFPSDHAAVLTTFKLK